MPRLRIATRKSKLAIWQTNWVSEQLQKAYPDLSIEYVELTTQGDIKLDSSLSKVGGKGLFLKELEEALLDGRADMAVHSLKDVPMQLDSVFCLPAFMPRTTPLDALCAKGKTLDTLPAQAIVGTSSLRRQAQLLAIRPDLRIKLIRGNVDTRVNKLSNGEYDAITLAACGLERLNLSEHISEYLSFDRCLPAIGQGIVVIEARADDKITQERVRVLHDAQAETVALAERSLGLALHCACQVPVAGYARFENENLVLRGWVGTPDGQRMLYATAAGAPEEAANLGLKVAQMLQDQGATMIIDQCISGIL